MYLGLVSRFGTRECRKRNKMSDDPIIIIGTLLGL